MTRAERNAYRISLLFLGLLASGVVLVALMCRDDAAAVRDLDAITSQPATQPVNVTTVVSTDEYLKEAMDVPATVLGQQKCLEQIDARLTALEQPSRPTTQPADEWSWLRWQRPPEDSFYRDFHPEQSVDVPGHKRAERCIWNGRPALHDWQTDEIAYLDEGLEARIDLLANRLERIEARLAELEELTKPLTPSLDPVAGLAWIPRPADMTTLGVEVWSESRGRIVLMGVGEGENYRRAYLDLGRPDDSSDDMIAWLPTTTRPAEEVSP